MKFVETTYTINENMGAVNVCINLTKPETDILEETVNVVELATVPYMKHY